MKERNSPYGLIPLEFEALFWKSNETIFASLVWSMDHLNLLMNRNEPITEVLMLNVLHNKILAGFTQSRTGDHKQRNVTSKSLASIQVRLTKLPLGAHNGEIVEYYDGVSSAYEELLYSIVVNRKEKGIIVVFRWRQWNWSNYSRLDWGLKYDQDHR